jgi:hypothetical protein
MDDCDIQYLKNKHRYNLIIVLSILLRFRLTLWYLQTLLNVVVESIWLTGNCINLTLCTSTFEINVSILTDTRCLVGWLVYGF